MMTDHNISYYLDQRRVKANGKYPLKLRVFTNKPRKQKLYSTEFEFNVGEFLKITIPVKRLTPKEKRIIKNECLLDPKAIKGYKKELDDHLEKAENVAKELKQFNFELFEIKLSQKKDEWHEVISSFQKIIQEKTKHNQISTAEKYQYAKVSFQKFKAYNNLKHDNWDKTQPEWQLVTYLDFSLFTEKYLKDYEYYWINKGRSKATLGIYLRNLRTVFNEAIKRGTITSEIYPFGQNKYEIPTSSKVNKALASEQIALLRNTIPINDDEAKAKDFWFFSYSAYGMNTKDICQLEHSSIQGDYFNYVRAKTKNTKKQETQKQVPITQSIRETINKYKDESSRYLFGIINDNDSPLQQHKSVKKFNDYINKHFRRLAKRAGIEDHLVRGLGTYHARHSFATIAIRMGKGIELISEILHDGNIQTTQDYLNSFPKETFKDLSDDLGL